MRVRGVVDIPLTRVSYGGATVGMATSSFMVAPLVRLTGGVGSSHDAAEPHEGSAAPCLHAVTHVTTTKVVLDVRMVPSFHRAALRVAVSIGSGASVISPVPLTVVEEALSSDDRVIEGTSELRREGAIAVSRRPGRAVASLVAVLPLTSVPVKTVRRPSHATSISLDTGEVRLAGGSPIYIDLTPETTLDPRTPEVTVAITQGSPSSVADPGTPLLAEEVEALLARTRLCGVTALVVLVSP